LKVWDLSYVIKKIGFNKSKNYPETKVSFNPKRKEIIDCTVIAKSLRNE
jgi:hypothetical protein